MDWERLSGATTAMETEFKWLFTSCLLHIIISGRGRWSPLPVCVKSAHDLAHRRRISLLLCRLIATPARRGYVCLDTQSGNQWLESTRRPVTRTLKSTIIWARLHNTLPPQTCGRRDISISSVTTLFYLRQWSIFLNVLDFLILCRGSHFFKNVIDLLVLCRGSD